MRVPAAPGARIHRRMGGLGKACEADVTVRWPDAELTTQSFALPAGHRFHVRQGEAPLVEA